MHEASITQSIIDSVLNTVADEKVAGKITAVHISIGVCQGLIPESIKMYFDMEKPDTPMENAELFIETQGMVAKCPTCEKEHNLDIPVMFCPDCGEPMKLLKGNEIIINSIEVEE